MILQGHQPPAPHKPTPPSGGTGQHKPAAPGHNKPAAPGQHKPAAPGHNKPAAPTKPSKPAPAKHTAGRGEIDFTWFDEVEYAPLAKGGHISRKPN